MVTGITRAKVLILVLLLLGGIVAALGYTKRLRTGSLHFLQSTLSHASIEPLSDVKNIPVGKPQESSNEAKRFHQVEDAINLDGCAQLYLDIGANVGVQIRKVFEPHLYPKSPVLEIFDARFGPAEQRARPSAESGLCAVGFEANPNRERRLKDIERAYSAKGWRVHFFVPRPVSDVGGKNVTLHLPPVSRWDTTEVGASLLWNFTSKVFRGGSSVVVTTLDITDWIKNIVAKRALKQSLGIVPYVLAKMDIEGSEYDVLPRMMKDGVFCAGVVDEMFIEWHKKGAGVSFKELHASVHKQIENFRYDSRSCPQMATKITRLDDELFFDDGKPLPKLKHK